RHHDPRPRPYARPATPLGRPPQAPPRACLPSSGRHARLSRNPPPDRWCRPVVLPWRGWRLGLAGLQHPRGHATTRPSREGGYGRLPQEVLVAEVAIASGNLRTVYVVGVDRRAGMTYRGHQGAGCEQRDDDGGARGANGDGQHGIPPEGWLISAGHYAALPVTGFAAHDSA